MMLLSLLFVKHWFVDFVLQTDDMIRAKGIYGSPMGILHALQHAAFTLALLLLATAPMVAIGLALLDGLLHYHIDWIKSNFGCKTTHDKKFWIHFGADQLAHALTYVFIFNALL